MTSRDKEQIGTEQKSVTELSTSKESRRAADSIESGFDVYIGIEISSVDLSETQYSIHTYSSSLTSDRDWHAGRGIVGNRLFGCKV